MLVTIDGESYAFEFKFRGCKSNTSVAARKETFIRDICRIEQIAGTPAVTLNANESSCPIPNIKAGYAVFLTNIEDFWKKGLFAGSNVKPGVMYFDAGMFVVSKGSSGGSRKVNKSAVPFNTARQQQGEWFMFIDDNGKQVYNYQYAIVEVV
ncbi:MAG: hypothetical protein LUE27_07710 [Clostridia bacterium]|nr:hypothetical protein [Clostridia bacterium]